jgi:hypothetical protein
MPSVGLLPSAGTRQKWNVPCAESLPSAWGSALGKEFVCRVPVVWHSAKNRALGIYAVSGSDDYIKNAQVHIQHAFSSIWFNVRFIYSTDDKAIYYERFVTTALEIWMTGTATHLKVHGHSLLPIMVGLYQIALQKD